MTVITEDFRRLDGIAPFPADLAFVYFTVSRRRQNDAGTWVVMPVEVKCRLVAGKLTSPSLDPGEATVRIGAHGPVYKIIIPEAGPTRLWPLIELYEPPDPPVVSLVKQYRDEVVESKDSAILSAFHAQQSEQEARRLAEEAATTVTGVVSIDGQQGAVTKAELGINLVDNTRDADKPISTAVAARLTTILEEIDGTFEDVSTALATKQNEAQVQAIAVAVATAKIADIIGNAPNTLDTVYELAAALGNQPNFAADVLAAIALKAPLASPNFSGSPTVGGISLVKGDDAKLYDARTPLAHEHSAAGITSGTLSVARGGTGRGDLVDGSFMRGAGGAAIQMRTPAQVRDDIGAGTSSLTLGATSATALRGDALRVVSSFPATGDDGVLYMTVE
ncbi:hypothetical protein C7T36_18475 [Rhodococcus sp. AD45-ID]|uniref:hypothetical protein n=1 Tax=unclassified Rhodococcus (in: high G+C Gram-positive bacteria) TaxID=192944 RepID=UPI0005E0DB61|nr:MULTISPECIES: hypothetical protein [unclassified Rhodococcus (in: high G+C Gram-positive bacteria)]KJF21969.1 hypothetical protein SZ00_02613 [Rhodococcus sp. AD45]PSR39664.1 hypothetical protein C7T36_18475 [Rhodococcus sp. AD45-ID]